MSEILAPDLLFPGGRGLLEGYSGGEIIVNGQRVDLLDEEKGFGMKLCRRMGMLVGDADASKAAPQNPKFATIKAQSAEEVADAKKRLMELLPPMHDQE